MAMGRDELNLAEFPLTALADRIPSSRRTLCFEDRVWDERTGQSVLRRLTISASDHDGLPTALDDEVLLGLIQVTRRQGFRERRVDFSRYELLQLLGWRDEGKSYRRLDASLRRWLGVTLYYENAWRDKASGVWIDAAFHFLDEVLWSRRSRRAARIGNGSERRGSSFTWNEIVFRSFQAGNLKPLDFALYRALRTAVAKRMYRFLDKRFYLRRRWEFDLRTFACEHVGLSRNYDAAQLKRRLNAAFAELERVGFLAPPAGGERYRAIRRGEWKVICVRQPRPAATGAATASATASATELVAALVHRGLSPPSARQLTVSFAAERIRGQLAVFDWLVGRRDARVSRNPAGWLRRAIEHDFSPPADFPRRPTLSRACAKPTETDDTKSGIQSSPSRVSRATLAVHADFDARMQRLDHYLAGLGSADLAAVERAAVAAAPRFLALQYERTKPCGGIAFSACRRMILERHLGAALAAKPAA